MSLTRIKSTEAVLLGRNRILQDLAGGASLEEVLASLARTAEEVFPEMRCSVLLADEDERRLRCVAGPSLPEAYVQAVNGIEVRPELGSCPAAVATGERVVVADIQTHPFWTDHRELAERHGLRACWAEPILAPSGQAIGSFAMYYGQPRTPRDEEVAFIETGAQLAGFAIERLRFEERLRESEERFRQIADHCTEAFWLVDSKAKRLLYINPAYETIWGRTVDEHMADPRGWRLQVHADDRDEVVSLYDGQATSGGYDVEFRVLRPDGTIRWVRDRAFPIRDADGHVHRLAGITTDITQHKQAEITARESEQHFRQLAENVSGVFWLTDWRKRRVLYISPAWEEIWGVDRDALMQGDPEGWTGNIHPDDRARVVERFEHEAEAGTYDIDFRVIHADGSIRWLHERAFPIRDHTGAVDRLAGVVEDITARKQVELELQAARDELEKRRRSQIETLTSQLLLAEERERRKLAQDLHDGTNQTVTLALLKLAQLRESTEGPVRERLCEIEGLIDEVNRASRSLTFQLSPPVLYDLGFEPAVQWLVEDIQRIHGLVIELESPEDPSPLEERVRVLLYRAVRELLINVAKHADAQRVRVVLAREEDRIRIQVEDDGVAFDPDRVGSRGLGLFGIRERLSHLGGSMAIESRPETGTSVTQQKHQWQAN